MTKKDQADKLVQCKYCGRTRKESASIYIVRTNEYFCSQSCVNKENELKMAQEARKGG